MSEILDLRAAIVAHLASLSPALDVAAHLGRFDATELKSFMASAPAIRVAVLALENPKDLMDDGVELDARIGIYVATRDGPTARSRDGAAIDLVAAILKTCHRARWGLGTICPAARAATAQNLYSAATLSAGVALWAIDLRQPVRLSTAETVDPDELTQLWFGFAPNIGTAHRDDYVGPFPQVSLPPVSP